MTHIFVRFRPAASEASIRPALLVLALLVGPTGVLPTQASQGQDFRALDAAAEAPAVLPSRVLAVDPAAGPPAPFDPAAAVQAPPAELGRFEAGGMSAPGEPTSVLVVPSFGGIFTETVRDFRRLPSRENAAWLGIGIAVAAAGHGVDREVSAEFAEDETLAGFFRPGAVMGSAAVHLAGGFASYAIGRGTGNPRLASFGADLLRAQLVSQGITQAIKLTAGRTRPDGSNSYSFPSGHTSTVFASATVVRQHFGWKWGIPAYAAASYVAASRVQMQKHYLSDVAFGAMVGIVAGRTVAIGGSRFGMEPMFTAGGGGVSFRLLHSRP